jgi:hypothetical protein
VQPWYLPLALLARRGLIDQSTTPQPTMNTTARSSKDQIITAATEAIDWHASQAAELRRQRVALLIACVLLAVIAAF